MGFGGYASALEFFEGVKAAATEADRTWRELSAMQAVEGVKAQRYTQAVAVGSNRDVMGLVDKRIDYESKLYRQLEDDYALIGTACEVLFGEDCKGSGGIERLLGSDYASVLYWRYVGHMSTREVSELVGCSHMTCIRMTNVSLETCDLLGFNKVVKGIGTTEGNNSNVEKLRRDG